jgi:hypothetical protein
MFWENFRAFMAKPFKAEDMSAADWFWFMGLIIVILIAWKLIFRHIQEVV